MNEFELKVIAKIEEETLIHKVVIDDKDNQLYICGYGGQGEYLATKASDQEVEVINKMLSDDKFIISTVHRVEGAIEVEYINEVATANHISGFIVRSRERLPKVTGKGITRKQPLDFDKRETLAGSDTDELLGDDGYPELSESDIEYIRKKSGIDQGKLRRIKSSLVHTQEEIDQNNEAWEREQEKKDE